MPEFSQVVPVLRVRDMQKSLDFYTKILGFELCWHTEQDGAENAMIKAGDSEVLLSTGSHLGGEPAFTGTLYFKMIGVDEYYDLIKNKVDVVWPLEKMDYGQSEFGIHDLDGYVLAFAEEE